MGVVSGSFWRWANEGAAVNCQRSLLPHEPSDKRSQATGERVQMSCHPQGPGEDPHGWRKREKSSFHCWRRAIKPSGLYLTRLFVHGNSLRQKYILITNNYFYLLEFENYCRGFILFQAPGMKLICQFRRMQEMWVGSSQEDPLQEIMIPTPVFLTGEFHDRVEPGGLLSIETHKKSDTTETTSTSVLNSNMKLLFLILRSIP